MTILQNMVNPNRRMRFMDSIQMCQPVDSDSSWQREGGERVALATVHKAYLKLREHIQPVDGKEGIAKQAFT